MSKSWKNEIFGRLFANNEYSQVTNRNQIVCVFFGSYSVGSG